MVIDVLICYVVVAMMRCVYVMVVCMLFCVFNGVCVWMFISFFFQAEDGIRYLVRSRGLGDVYKRQPLPVQERLAGSNPASRTIFSRMPHNGPVGFPAEQLSLIHI